MLALGAGRAFLCFEQKKTGLKVVVYRTWYLSVKTKPTKNIRKTVPPQKKNRGKKMGKTKRKKWKIRKKNEKNGNKKVNGKKIGQKQIKAIKGKEIRKQALKQNRLVGNW